jgi:methyltransferase (TIGR00027 family)
MNPSDASRTALATALMRARHSRLDPAPLIDDRWGDRLVPDSFRAALGQRALQRMGETARARALAQPLAAVDDFLRESAAYADVVLRARYTEDALQAAVARGIRQYVLIGAGFDSFACRRPAWARDLEVVEVDHPATQQLKRQRLVECGVADSPRLHFVAADLSRETLAAALARSAFRPGEATFFAWIGVTMYLTPQANLAALRDIAGCGAPGSELVFTCVDEAALDPGHAVSPAFRQLQAQVAAVGEAFLSGFDPKALPALLLDLGLSLLEDVNGEDLAAGYDPAGLNALLAAAEAHVVHARW